MPPTIGTLHNAFRCFGNAHWCNAKWPCNNIGIDATFHQHEHGNGIAPIASILHQCNSVATPYELQWRRVAAVAPILCGWGVLGVPLQRLACTKEC